MKRYLIACAMALAAAVVCESRLMAWTNFHLQNNFNMGFQSGGNRLGWGLWASDPYPIVTMPNGMATYPAPQQLPPWMMYRMMMMNQGCCHPMAGYGQGYGAQPMMAYGGGMMPGAMPWMQAGMGMPPMQMPAYGYGGMNNFWAPGMAMNMPMQMQMPMPMQMGMMPPMGQMGGYPGMMPQQGWMPPQMAMMPNAMMQQGMPNPMMMQANPMAGMMSGYPGFVAPQPTFQIVGPAVPVQGLPSMPSADGSQPAAGPPVNAQRIGYVWETPLSLRGPMPSYWLGQ